MLLFNPRLAWLILPLLCAVPLRADIAQDWAEADAKVTAAQTPLDKINALFRKAGVPIIRSGAARADWEMADKSLDELFRLLDAEEKKGKISPQSFLHFRRGYVAAQLENYKDAITFYDEAERQGYIADNSKEKNKGSELFDNRGNVKAALYDFKGAIDDLTKAIALKEQGYWYKDRAKTYFEMGDWDNAVADWQKAIALEPTLKNLDNSLPFAEYLIPSNKAIAANPNSSALFMERAIIRLKRFRSGYESNQAFDPTIYIPTNSFKESEQIEEAIKDLQRSVKLKSGNAAAWRELGKVRGYFWMLKNETKGFSEKYGYDENAPLQNFERALNAEDSNALTLLEMGMYLANRYGARRQPSSGEKSDMRQRDDADAMTYLGRAILEKPNASADAHYQRALLESRAAKPDTNTLLVDFSAVISDINKTIGVAPDERQKSAALAMSHLVRGRIYLSRGQRNAALRDLDAALVLETSTGAHFERGKLLFLRGDYEAAKKDLDAVIRANDAKALSDEAFLVYLTDDKAKQEELSRQIRTDNAKANAQPWFFLAGVYDGQGETQKAKDALAKAFLGDASLKNRVRGTRYDEANPTNRSLASTPNKNDAPLSIKGTALEHKNTGDMLSEKGDGAGALAEYNAAILLDANFADAYNKRGEHYLMQGKYDLALADLNRAIELNPKHRVAYIHRSNLWHDLNQEDKKRADLARADEVAATP